MAKDELTTHGRFTHTHTHAPLKKVPENHREVCQSIPLWHPQNHHRGDSHSHAYSGSVCRGRVVLCGFPVALSARVRPGGRCPCGTELDPGPRPGLLAAPWAGRESPEPGAGTSYLPRAPFLRNKANFWSLKNAEIHTGHYKADRGPLLLPAHPPRGARLTSLLPNTNTHALRGCGRTHTTGSPPTHTEARTSVSHKHGIIAHGPLCDLLLWL